MIRYSPLSIILLLTATWAQAQDTIDVRWRGNYATARKEAEQQNLPLILDFGTVDCYWCKKLDESTFKDPKVVELMNRSFIPLKVDANKEVNLANILRITSYPTIVFAAPDGRILGTIEGFQSAEKFYDNMGKVVASLAPPEWMQRDLASAKKWLEAKDYARASIALKGIVQDGKSPAMTQQAKKLLDEIETKAREHVAAADILAKAGKTQEAVTLLGDTLRIFAGTQATKAASDALLKIATTQVPAEKNEQRVRKAKELLTQAREFYKNQDYIPSLDRCEILLQGFGDLEEGQEAAKLAREMKANPEWMQAAADTMSDRLGTVYLSLAELLLKRGQPDRALFYLQRVVAAFPGSRQAESAQIRLTQIQALISSKGETETASNPMQ